MVQDSHDREGLIIFIKKHLGNAVPPPVIVSMLEKAGFEKAHIEDAFQEVKKQFPDTHQDVSASNNFLPSLEKQAVPIMPKVLSQPIQKEMAQSTPSIIIPPVHTPSSPSVTMSPDQHASPSAVFSPPPFPTAPPVTQVQRPQPYSLHTQSSPRQEGYSPFTGRLHRRDFLMGFLFLFGLGVVIMFVVLMLINIFYPDFNTILERAAAEDTYGLFFSIIPFVEAPLSFLMISILARRLHDIGLPGLLAPAFLVFFVPLFTNAPSWMGVFALQCMMGLLFLVLLVKRGDEGANMYGDKKEIKGSFFHRLLHVE